MWRGTRVLVGSARLTEAEDVEMPVSTAGEARRASEGGQTVVRVAEGSRLLGALALADIPREEAPEAIASLRTQGEAGVLRTSPVRAPSSTTYDLLLVATRYHRHMTSPQLLLSEDPDALARLARVEILYTDLDGTLLGRGASVLTDDRGEPTLETVSAIVAVNKAWLTVVLVSGRNAIQLAEDTRLLGWTDFIGEVGCIRSVGRERSMTYDTGDWPEGAIPEGMTPYEAILDAGALEALFSAFPGRIERHLPWDSDRLATHILRGEVDIVRAQTVLDQLPLPVHIVDNGIIHPPRHTLVGVERVHAYHLVPAGASKARAIANDLAARGLPREAAAAIGDSATDLQMAASVGVMVLVANGLDSPGLAERIAETPNAYATRARQGHGWAEFARLWLAARDAG